MFRVKRFFRSKKSLSLFLTLLILLGCQTQQTVEDKPLEPQTRIVPVSNNEVAALTADDVVMVMRRAGFSSQQILDWGTDLRNHLAKAGAANIRINDKVEAIFAVRENNVHVSTRTRGSFIYDLENGEIR